MVKDMLNVAEFRLIGTDRSRTSAIGTEQPLRAAELPQWVEQSQLISLLVELLQLLQALGQEAFYGRSN
jgi:hypothetical protein